MGFYRILLTVFLILALCLDLTLSSGSISLIGLDFYNIKSATPGCLYEGQHLQHSHDDCRYLECRLNLEAQERWCPPGLSVDRHLIHVVPTANPCTVRRAKCSGFYSPQSESSQLPFHAPKFRYGHLAEEEETAITRDPWWKPPAPHVPNVLQNSQTMNGLVFNKHFHANNNFPVKHKPDIERNEAAEAASKIFRNELEESQNLRNHPTRRHSPRHNFHPHATNLRKRRRHGNRKRRFKFMENKFRSPDNFSPPGMALPFTGTNTFHQQSDDIDHSRFFAHKKFFPYAVRFQSPNLEYLETVYSAMMKPI